MAGQPVAWTTRKSVKDAPARAPLRLLHHKNPATGKMELAAADMTGSGPEVPIHFQDHVMDPQLTMDRASAVRLADELVLEADAKLGAQFSVYFPDVQQWYTGKNTCAAQKEDEGFYWSFARLGTNKSLETMRAGKVVEVNYHRKGWSTFFQIYRVYYPCDGTDSWHYHEEVSSFCWS